MVVIVIYCILIILIEISSWPWALCMFKALISLIILSSLKTKEPSIDWIKNILFVESTLFFFNGVYCSEKTDWKWLPLFWYQLQIYCLSKEEELAKCFCCYKKFSELTNTLLAVMDYIAGNNGLFNLFSLGLCNIKIWWKILTY